MQQLHAVNICLTLASLALSTIAVTAQTPCSLKLTDLPPSPELRGFRLGMTKDEVKTSVPQVLFPPDDEIGIAKTTINPDFDPKIDKRNFAGIRSVSLDFLDSKLTSLWFGYDSTFKWKTVEEFVSGITETLKLPDVWQPWRGKGQQLRCTDFVMTATSLADGVTFRIVDQSAEDVIAERRAAKEEERATAENEAEQEETDVTVIADKRTKLYFTTQCSMSSTLESKDKVVFANAEEAEKAGYKRSQLCP